MPDRKRKRDNAGNNLSEKRQEIESVAPSISMEIVCTPTTSSSPTVYEEELT